MTFAFIGILCLVGLLLLASMYDGTGLSLVMLVIVVGLMVLGTFSSFRETRTATSPPDLPHLPDRHLSTEAEAAATSGSPASQERAQMLLTDAEMLNWRVRFLTNEERKSKLREESRDNIARARAIYQAARDNYKQEYDRFSVYIPEENGEQRAQRNQVESLYIKSQLDLARCTYLEAQTYARDSDDFQETLRQAALEYEEIHTRYRSQLAGLYARAMQGKCFEEQDNIRLALGIYGELLGHEGKSEGLKRLQHQVRLFRLICLNHETRNDHQLVRQEAEAWLEQNLPLAKSQFGSGIRWELARALEALANQDSRPEEDRLQLREQAIEHARRVQRHSPGHKILADEMIQRLQPADEQPPPAEKTSVGEVSLNEQHNTHEGLPVFGPRECEALRIESESLPRRLVVQSQLWSTPEEAEQQAEALAEQLVGKVLGATHASKFWPQPALTAHEVWPSLEERRQLETREMALTGNINSRMHRVLITLDFQQYDAEALAGVVRQSVTRHRLTLLAGGLAASTLLIGCTAWLLRRRSPRPLQPLSANS